MEQSPAAASRHVVGREDELAAIDRLLADARERFSALMLEGEAGIGKTAVLDQALRLAEQRGFHVLACRPSAPEATLSLAAVCDLLAAVPAGLWVSLPGPQRRALDVALLRAEPGDLPVDQRAIAAGFRALVTGLAADRPVLLAVDDTQWLDPASATILAFLLRRLDREQVGVLATRRVSEAAPLDIATLVRPDAFRRARLGPLSVGALQHTVWGRLGVTIPRSTLVRVHATSHGNPLFALEMARLLVERDATLGDEPLPVPDDIRELVRSRVAALPAATRDLLLAVALLARPEVDTLRSAFGGSLDADLEPAQRAAIAGRDGDVIAFAHPLHAAAVVAVSATVERRRMHRVLAENVKDVEERARHLALGADGPDEAIAKMLEEGAHSARARGGLHSAAELLESARVLTPPSNREAACVRGLRGAELHLHGGDRGRARSLLEELLAQTLEPAHHSQALRLLAELTYGEENPAEAERLLHDALAADDDPHRSGRALLDLVHLTALRMDFAGAAALGRRALESLEGSADGPLLAEALAYSAMTTFLAGGGVDWSRVERALTLHDPDRIGPLGLPAGAVVGILFLYAGRHAEAREQLRTVRAQLLERGDEGDLAHVLLWSSWLELRCGDFEAASRLADDADACAELSDNVSIRQWVIAQRALVDAHRGDIDAARRMSAEAERLVERGVSVVALFLADARALAELSVGDPAAAWEACRPLTEAVEQTGLGEPIPFFFLPNAIEALVTLGELDRAEALVALLEQRGRELDRAWATATGARCRGLVLAARGDLLPALAAVDLALAEQERVDMPFERARTLLAKGIIERRARQRTAARRSLEEAKGEFERMGARRWADRARAELDRLSGRRPRGEAELTPSEMRVVELAAEGLSNKEIAARLVVSVHTVEVHLSRAYGKLGVRSRGQAARRLSSPT